MCLFCWHPATKEGRATNVFAEPHGATLVDSARAQFSAKTAGK